MASHTQSGAVATMPPATATGKPNIRRLLGMKAPVSVQLAEREMNIESILAIRVGTIIEFSTPFDSEQILHVSNRPIGRGQSVKVGEHFGLRISHIAPVEERIESLRSDD